MIARAVILLATCGVVSFGDATKADLDKMQGEWKPTKVIVNGEALKDDVMKDRLTIKDKAFVFVSGDDKSNGTLMIDASKKPPHLDTRSTGPDKKPMHTVGIYEFDGNKLKVCYCVAPNPRPTDFTVEKGSARALVIYERVR